MAAWMSASTAAEVRRAGPAAGMGHAHIGTRRADTHVRLLRPQALQLAAERDARARQVLVQIDTDRNGYIDSVRCKLPTRWQLCGAPRGTACAERAAPLLPRSLSTGQP